MMNKTLGVPSMTSLAARASKTAGAAANGSVPASVPVKDEKEKKAREALSNITNKGAGQGKTKAEKSKSFKSTKRILKHEGNVPAAVAPTAGISGATAPAGGMGKEAKKSDPMLIDEEELAAVKWTDIDVEDFDDPQAVTEYVNEIYDNLFEKEKKDRIPSNFLDHQDDINEKMRAILVDWLVEVHRMFKLIPETLFLCISIIDRYLTVKPVSRDKLQLVGITAMLIASKYEEIYAPESNDFVYISDGAFSKDQILLMEQQILNTLNFNFLHPSPLHFLRRFSKAAGSDYTIHTLCKYLIELMMLDVNMYKYTASQIAAGSVFIARSMTQKAPLWTGNLHHYSTYSEPQVYAVAVEMNEFLKKSQKSSLKALKKKYSGTKFGQVAEMPVVDI